VSDLFAWPGALTALLLVPLVWLGLTALDRARARRLARVAGPRAQLLVRELSVAQRRLRRGLTTAGLLLACVAAMQPRWGLESRTAELRGVDILVCLDVSRSMLAQDLRPNRLQRAQREIRSLAQHVRGDQIGLVAFAGEAQLIAPLTRDMDSLGDLVDLTSPVSVQLGGTDLGAALEAALAALEGQDGDHETVVLITDGEDLGQRGLAVAQICAELNITVHCMGIGSRLGSKIPLRNEGGEAFLRTRSGEEVVSAMNAPGLRRIAEITGGGFVDASTSPQPLIDLYEDQILPMARKSFESAQRPERKNRFQWPLLGAFLLWILGFCLTDRTKR
jgi:Ca-activated chloride channel family protein